MQLSPEQLHILSARLEGSGYARVVVEETNLDQTIAMKLGGRTLLIHANGSVAVFSADQEMG